jgi:hypothetical protein
MDWKRGPVTGLWRFPAAVLASTVLAFGFASTAGVMTARADAYSTGPYLNPLRGASLTPARIDQGVDFYASGGVYAIGDGVVEKITDAGWPHGIFIEYRLSDGPFLNYGVYTAECITPASGLKIGSVVSAYTLIGTAISCKDLSYPCDPCGIEIGWADRSHLGAALGKSQWDGVHSTAYGVNFNNFLLALNGRSGNLMSPVLGSTPVGWPTSSHGAMCSTKPGFRFSQLAAVSHTQAVYPQGQYAGDETVSLYIDRYIAPDSTWCFQLTAYLSLANGTITAPTGSFNLNIRVDCNHARQKLAVAFEQSYTKSIGHVTTGWWPDSSAACNISWGSDDAYGSYGSQVEDQWHNKYNKGIPSLNYTYLTFGTL